MNQQYNIKFIVLISLCIQNASHALLARYAQGYLKEKFSSTDVVLVAEVIKGLASAYFVLTDSSSESDSAGRGLSKLLWLLQNSRNVIVLVILYAAANILSYFALARLDAALYAVLAQVSFCCSSTLFPN